MWAKRSFCYHTGKKASTPKRLRSIFSQFCHKHVGSSSKMELVMEAFCLHWKLRAYFQRFSVVPPWDLPCWQEQLASIFSRFVAYASVTTYPVNVTSNLCLRTFTIYCKRSNIYFTLACQRYYSRPTPPHL